MDAGIVGALIGVVIAALSYFFFTSIYVDILEERGDKNAPLFRFLAYTDWLFYPVLGYWLASWIAG